MGFNSGLKGLNFRFRHSDTVAFGKGNCKQSLRKLRLAQSLTHND